VVGEQLFLNDVLYDVTSPISVEDAIVVGTNITAANKISANIQTLTNQVTGLLDNTEVNGAVNMLPNTNVTQTKYGITYTVNDDGSITASGTATSVNGLYQNITLPKGTYKLSGCPSGGSQNTYYIGIVSLNIYDYGDGAIFTLSQETTIEVTIARINDTTTTYSGLTFKPMITVLSYDGDYVPYAKSNKELTEDFIPKVLTVTPNASYVDNDNLHATKYGQLIILGGYFRVHTEGARGAVLYTLPSSVKSFSGDEVSGLALGNYGSAILLTIGDSNTLKVELASGIPAGWYSIMMVMLNKTENI
jgi:hypothetical protein